VSDFDATTVRDALFDFVVSATEIAEARILWAEQVEARAITPPPTPWISLRQTASPAYSPTGVRYQKNSDAFREFTADAATDKIALTAHGFATGDGPVHVLSTIALPGGLAARDKFWVVVVDADHLQLATSHANAVAVSPVVVDLTSAGTGTHTLVVCGQELLVVATGHEQGTLQVTCYGGDVGDAVALLRRIRLARQLPSIAAALRAASVGVLSIGSVASRDGYVGASRVFEPRAEVLVEYVVPVRRTETASNIERATVTDPETGLVFEVDSPPLPA